VRWTFAGSAKEICMRAEPSDSRRLSHLSVSQQGYVEYRTVFEERIWGLYLKRMTREGLASTREVLPWKAAGGVRVTIASQGGGQDIPLAEQITLEKIVVSVSFGLSADSTVACSASSGPRSSTAPTSHSTSKATSHLSRPRSPMISPSATIQTPFSR